MKTMRPAHLLRKTLRPPASKEARSNLENVIKYITTGTAILGIMAWIAGYAYLYAFWASAGFTLPIGGLSIQEVAFFGFVPNIVVWLSTIALLLSVGIAYMLMGVLIGTYKDKILIRLPRPIRATKIKYEPSLFNTGGVLSIVALTMSLIAIFLSMWTLAAMGQGKSSLINEICNDPLQTSTINFGPSGEKQGKIINQINNYSLIFSEKTIFFVLQTETPIILGQKKINLAQCKINH